LAGAIDHYLLEQFEPGFFFVEDLRGLGVDRQTLLGVEGVSGLLHQVVEALAGLAAHPVLAPEAVRMEEPPQAAVGVEQGGLRVDQQEPGGRDRPVVVHALARRHLHHRHLGADSHFGPHVGHHLEQVLVVHHRPGARVEREVDGRGTSRRTAA
jgi:hypothetical protein